MNSRKPSYKYHRLSMTSETEEKSLPFIARAKNPYYNGRYGLAVVISMWIILYFWGVVQLIDGVIEWFSYSTSDYVVRVAVGIATTAISVMEAGQVEFGSTKYYLYCAFGGVLSCGLTHTAIVPLDLIKCRIQVNPEKYKGIVSGFRTTVAEEGVRALAKGWAPTLVGYSLQGLGKFGFYEVFKNVYADMLGEENAYLYRTSLYLAASASAEFFADILLAPMEATKVRVQTSPGAPPTLRGCAPLIYKNEGLTGFYKGLPPLWMRQIPYTMMKFACFEKTVEALYKYVVPKPRNECSKSEQLVVTFVAGYIAGVFCAVVSHPADTIVSKLNQDSSATAGGILKKLGFAGVWKGLVPRIIMIGTLTALQWFIYDSVKVALNLPRPPPPEMPASLKAKLALQGQ